MTVLLRHFPQKKTQPRHLHGAQRPVCGRAQGLRSLLAAGACHHDMSVPVGHKSPGIGTLGDGPAMWPRARFMTMILILHFSVTQMLERSLGQQRKD